MNYKFYFQFVLGILLIFLFFSLNIISLITRQIAG